MSTRAVIARRTGTDATPHFAGVYNHWDGYPSGLGATLFDLYRTQFARDLPRMLTTLIDAHPAGWSTINGADWSIDPGFGQRNGPACYCHGERAESGELSRYLMTDGNASGSGCEYAYVFENFDGAFMHVLSSYRPDGDKMIGMFGLGNPAATWREIGLVDLNGPEPDWMAME